jgi:hypothetical protein
MARRIAGVAIGEMNPLSWLWEAYSMLRDSADAAEAVQAIAAGDATLHNAIEYWQERALKAEATQMSEPEGWKLVPIKPTQKMLDAPQHTWQPEALHVWNAMLGAAPSQPRRPAHPRVEVTDELVDALRAELSSFYAFRNYVFDDERVRAALKAALSEKGHE